MKTIIAVAILCVLVVTRADSTNAVATLGHRHLNGTNHFVAPPLQANERLWTNHHNIHAIEGGWRWREIVKEQISRDGVITNQTVIWSSERHPIQHSELQVFTNSFVGQKVK